MNNCELVFMNLYLAFLTGLTLGGLTCAAVQGALLTSLIANQKRLGAFWITAAFLVSKLFAYTLLGFFLGSLGGAISFSTTAQIFIQSLAGIYMLLVAANLLNLHPIFRYVIIQPPRFITRRIRSEAKSSELFSPVVLGLLTVFVPCGTTISMELISMSSGSGITGAMFMGVFILGTMPLFFILGMAAGGFKKFFDKYFAKVAVGLLVYLGASSVNGALVLANSPVTLTSVKEGFLSLGQIVVNPARAPEVRGAKDERGAPAVKFVDGVQVADIAVYATSYKPNYLEVKAGMPVRLNLSVEGDLGCTSVFVIPSLDIVKPLGFGGAASVEFTPEKQGTITWTCSMGMYTGTIKVS